MSKLEGRVAVVTGGSSGIGLAAAHELVEEGAFVYIMGRRQAELDRAVEAIGRNVVSVRGDIADLDDLDRLYAKVKADSGRLDIIVASAAIVEVVTFADSTPEHFDKIFGVNARGTYFTVQKALPLLRDGSSIVLMSSALHQLGVPIYTTYSATKAALRSFARSWAAELKERRIRVNTLSPGPIETPMIDGQFHFKSQAEADSMRAFLAKTVPLGRMGTAEEIAKAVLFLASDDSSFCTGMDLVADGGVSEL